MLVRAVCYVVKTKYIKISIFTDIREFMVVSLL